MNFRKTALLVTLGMAALTTPLAPTLAFAADGDSYMTWTAEVKKMADKDGMVSRQSFLEMMGKKFDAMDTGKKGMLSPDDVMRIFGRSDKA